MARNIFKGLGVALITPFTSDGSVDFKSLTCLVEHLIDNGADFLCILATTSEAPCLSAYEKEEVKKHVIDINRGRLPILMGCGGNNTKAIVDELKNSDWRGIDGVLSVCPYYNKPSQEGLYQHFKAIAEASPLPARFDVISGDDALTFSMVASGAAGSISVIGNALPKEVSRMIRLEFNGEYEAARTIHHRFTELYSLLFIDGNPAGVKALLHEMGFIENVLRLPLVPTRITTLQKMTEILKTLKI